MYFRCFDKIIRRFMSGKSSITGSIIHIVQESCLAAFRQRYSNYLIKFFPP